MVGRSLVFALVVLACAAARAQAPDDFDDSEFQGPDTESAPAEAETEVSPETFDGFEPEAETEPRPLDEAPRPLPTRGPGSLTPRGVDEAPAGPTDDRPLPPPPPGPDRAGVDVVSEAAIDLALSRRASAMLTGDLGAAELAVSELVEVKRNLGLRNIPVAAALLLHDAQRALRSDRIDAAVELADSAALLGPDLPAPHWTSAVARFRQDPTQVVQIGYALSSMLRAWVVPFRNAVTFWSWVFASAGLAFVVTAVGFTIVQAAKYLRYPAHDISNRITGVFGSGEFSLLFLTVILVPYALGFGFVTSTVLALGALFAYQTLRERLATVALMIGLAALPIALRWMAPFIAFHGSRVDALAAAYSENLDPAMASRLDDLAREDPQQRLIYHRINAYRARQRGDLEAARRSYEQVVEQAPSDPSALNNLAILQFVGGDQEAARRSFELAVASGRAEPRLNLSLLLADEGQFAEADAMLARARRIDPRLTEAFTSLDGVRPAAQRFVEVPLPEALLWAQFFDVRSAERRRIAAELWRPVGGRMPSDAFPFFALLSFAVGLMLSRRRKRLSLPCSKCGRPAPGEPGTPFCEQCISVFVSGVAVEPKVRHRKELEVRRHQRRRRWIERVLALTGLGLAVGERPLEGLALTFTIAFGLGATIMLPLLQVSAWSLPVGEEASMTAMVLLVGLAAAASAISVQRSFAR